MTYLLIISGLLVLVAHKYVSIVSKLPITLRSSFVSHLDFCFNLGFVSHLDEVDIDPDINTMVLEDHGEVSLVSVNHPRKWRFGESEAT